MTFLCFKAELRLKAVLSADANGRTRGQTRMALEKKYRHGAEKPPGEDREVVRRGIRIFLILLLVIGALLVGGGTIVFRMDRAEYLKELQRIESNSLDLQTTAIARELDHIMADVLFLASQNELILHLDTGDRKAVRDMEREYLHLAHSRQVYDQIRFLDASGRERVRVNSRDGQARIVSRDRLQDKSARYYFKECIALDRGGVFLSPMDLNVEAGRIEQPYRPMLRIGTPVFDTEGRKRGVVLVNYDAQNLLDRILRTGATARGVTMLLNCRGYWLISPDPNKEWGFMFPDKADETFANAYPAEWKRIVSEGKGQFRTRNGLFTFAVTDPEAELRRFSDMVRASTVPAPGGDVPRPLFLDPCSPRSGPERWTPTPANWWANCSSATGRSSWRPPSGRGSWPWPFPGGRSTRSSSWPRPCSTP